MIRLSVSKEIRGDLLVLEIEKAGLTNVQVARNSDVIEITADQIVNLYHEESLVNLAVDEVEKAAREAGQTEEEIQDLKISTILSERARLVEETRVKEDEANSEIIPIVTGIVSEHILPVSNLAQMTPSVEDRLALIEEKVARVDAVEEEVRGMKSRAAAVEITNADAVKIRNAISET